MNFNPDDYDDSLDQLDNVMPKLFTNVDVIKPPEYYLPEDDENFKDIRIVVTLEDCSIHFNIEYNQLMNILMDQDVCAEMNLLNQYSEDFLTDVLEAADEKLTLYEYFEFTTF